MNHLEDKNAFLSGLDSLHLTESNERSIDFCNRHLDDKPEDFLAAMGEEGIPKRSISATANMVFKKINSKVIEENNPDLTKAWRLACKELESPLLMESRALRLPKDSSITLLPSFYGPPDKSNKMGRPNYVKECARVMVEALDFYRTDLGFLHNREAVGIQPLTRREQDIEALRMAEFLQCELPR